MTASWILDALSPSALSDADTDASRRLIGLSLGREIESDASAGQRFIGETLELALIDRLTQRSTTDSGTREYDDVTTALARKAFHVLRVIDTPGSALSRAKMLLRTGCIGILADRGADVTRLLTTSVVEELPVESESWGERTEATVVDAWLRMLRKRGWSDLQTLQSRVVALRSAQSAFEAAFLEGASGGNQRRAAWELMLLYHLSKAAELLGVYTTEGRVTDGFDIREQLQSHFDRALVAAARAELVEWEHLTRLLVHASTRLVENSIWTATRAINPQISDFVKQIVKDVPRPIFDLLPPQREALRKSGLRGGDRAVVVNLPTSSGKTFIAQFRILQALNQFQQQAGWVAYLAPTRALVNQICSRLRRDFGPLGISVERVSPALEVDAVELGLLTEGDAEARFRVLVTTPEKLDLLIRGGFEEQIGRKLTLVVVDEAHNLGRGDRGLKLELLLATINRECEFAQFLLLTPFISNATEVARWLSPESYSTVDLSVEWTPNDRVIALSRPVSTGRSREFRLDLETLHTSHHTLSIPERVEIANGRPLDLTYSKVTAKTSDLAAATAQSIKSRGPTIVLCGRPAWAWNVAARFRRPENLREPNDDVKLVQSFLQEEFGPEFALVDLLNYGVGVHHSGLSDEAKGLMEWLFEAGQIDILTATTTIAQGMNFPVSGVVVAHHTFFEKGRTRPMPASDFWNIAGRAGRADQASIGLVALAATDDAKAAELRDFVASQVLTLDSTLVEMVNKALAAGQLAELHTLFYQPEWSAFLQYLAHSYRQWNNPEKFSQQLERILRGTLGFQKLRDTNRELAQALVERARAYGARIAGKPLSLVDSTGFSWESVFFTLQRLSSERISEEVWTPDLFTGSNRSLQKLMGILLQVPELRENLEAAIGGRKPDGNLLARIVSDWVNGVTIPDLASEYFSKDKAGNTVEVTDAVSDCCRNLFGKLTQTASWGLSALQAMTLDASFDGLSEKEQSAVRNLPSKVFYGVSSDDAISLRLLGVPRRAAGALAATLASSGGALAGRRISDLRSQLVSADATEWSRALGAAGDTYRRVWTRLENLR